MLETKGTEGFLLLEAGGKGASLLENNTFHFKVLLLHLLIRHSRVCSAAIGLRWEYYQEEV